MEGAVRVLHFSLKLLLDIDRQQLLGDCTLVAGGVSECLI